MHDDESCSHGFQALADAGPLAHAQRENIAESNTANHVTHYLASLPPRLFHYITSFSSRKHSQWGDIGRWHISFGSCLISELFHGFPMDELAKLGCCETDCCKTDCCETDCCEGKQKSWVQAYRSLAIKGSRRACCIRSLYLYMQQRFHMCVSTRTCFQRLRSMKTRPWILSGCGEKLVWQSRSFTKRHQILIKAHMVWQSNACSRKRVHARHCHNLPCINVS